MKCTSEPFSISASYRTDLLRKAQAFRDESKTRSAVHTVVIAAAGFGRNANADVVIQSVDGDELF